jgi:hypothetical protein
LQHDTLRGIPFLKASHFSFKVLLIAINAFLFF